MRVAICGCGPKGCYGIERLLAWAETRAVGDIELTVFEPHAFPGAGPAYDPEGPRYLLMNYPAGKIDLTHPHGPHHYRGGSFVEGSGADPGDYPSRARVGQYLHAGLNSMLDDPPLPVSIVSSPVRELTRAGREWLVDCSSGTERFDEVLLAVGHHRPPAPRLDAAAPGSVVALQGIGLTAIDLILELTEGRGGSFEGSVGDGLRYRLSGAEPARIMPWSRSGRPMLIKPDLPPARARVAREAVERIREEIAAFERPVDLRELIAAQARLADELLLAVSGEPMEGAGPRRWLEAAAAGSLRPCLDPLTPLAYSLAVNLGRAAAGLEWALGAAWRESYPAIVVTHSHGGLRASDRAPFARLAAELERLAFGPPPLNAAKLIALAELGILDLSHPTGPPPTADQRLDARIPPPGLHPDQPPTGSLLAEGLIRRPPGVRGIEIDRSARCIGRSGEPTPGLAATGRITEDWVVGNDTLSRSLHPQLDRWAKRICTAATGAEEAGSAADPLLAAGGSR